MFVWTFEGALGAFVIGIGLLCGALMALMMLIDKISRSLSAFVSRLRGESD